jgi:signal transduction histidine kinase
MIEKCSTPDWTAGVSMAVMRERASELGGSCAIRPTLPGGTTVDARLPVGPT